MRLPVVVRGLGYRRGSTAAMLTIAAIGCAAAALAPTYDAAAKTSIMRDTVSSASVIERGFEVREQGSLAHVLDPLSATVDRVVASASPARPCSAQRSKPSRQRRISVSKTKPPPWSIDQTCVRT